MQDVAKIEETSTMKENLTNQQNIIKELFKNNIQVKIFSIKVSLMLVVKFKSNQPSRAVIDQCQCPTVAKSEKGNYQYLVGNRSDLIVTLGKKGQLAFFR